MKNIVRTSFALLTAGLLLNACVPRAELEKSQAQNKQLKKEAIADQVQAVDDAQQVAELADKSTDLAIQNHYLKIDNADLKKQAAERDAFYDSVAYDLRQQVTDGRLKILRYRDLLTLEVADAVLFSSAKADLKPQGRDFLMQIGKVLAHSDRTIRVAGHTDDQPMAKGAKYSSNWELSTARATTVVRFFQDRCEISPQRLLAAGRGQWMPVASNATTVGRQMNRRISITLIDQSLLDGFEGYEREKIKP